MNRIILDTDIGTDIDDAMALALAMRSPEIILEGVTTVYGDVELRARMAKKILQYGGSENVPVFAGIGKPLLRRREVWMAGHEGSGILTGQERIAYEPKHAVDFIIETVMANPGQITIVPIGPLTNIAASLIREPELANRVKEIILMGGVTRLGDNGIHLGTLEHNIVCDPEAAAVVFESGAPIVMVGCDVTLKVVVSEKEKSLLLQTGDPLNTVLANLLDQWFSFIQKTETCMHDPLTVSLLIDRTLVSTKKMNVQVEYDHRPRTGQTVATLADNGNVEVCLDVDHERFMKLFMNRLIAGRP